MKDLSTGVPLLQGRTKDELYEWPLQLNASAFYSSPSPKTSFTSWYSRLGHPSPAILNKVVSSFSLPLSQSSNKQLSCSHCLINKSHKLPFAQTSISSTRPLQYIFSNVWTSPILSVENHRYYLILVDHYT